MNISSCLRSVVTSYRLASGASQLSPQSDVVTGTKTISASQMSPQHLQQAATNIPLPSSHFLPLCSVSGLLPPLPALPSPSTSRTPGSCIFVWPNSDMLIYIQSILKVNRKAGRETGVKVNMLSFSQLFKRMYFDGILGNERMPEQGSLFQVINSKKINQQIKKFVPEKDTLGCFKRLLVEYDFPQRCFISVANSPWRKHTR